MQKNTVEIRDNYFVFTPITTRWMDNDAYGHINNVTYYSYFDTAVNNYLIDQGGLDIQNSEIVGFVVNSSCNFNSSITYPDKIEVGLRVDKLGNSSVQYGIAIFKQGEIQASAQGQFIHVFVERKNNCSVSIPAKIKTALSLILKN